MHFGQGPADAPRKFDEGGIFVFNPGIGASYDFRSSLKTTGFSILINGLVFDDCQCRSMYTLGAGILGRLMLTENISGDLNVLPSIGKVGDYISFLPVVTLGMNYHFSKHFLLGTTFAFIPSFNDQNSNLVNARLFVMS